MSASSRRFLRRCVVCGSMKEKSELRRVVVTAGGEVMYDPSFRADGRGAYVCAAGACRESGRLKKSLERSLRCRITDSGMEDIIRGLCQVSVKADMED